MSAREAYVEFRKLTYMQQLSAIWFVGLMYMLFLK
jgi:hypothetical protein